MVVNLRVEHSVERLVGYQFLPAVGSLFQDISAHDIGFAPRLYEPLHGIKGQLIIGIEKHNAVARRRLATVAAREHLPLVALVLHYSNARIALFVNAQHIARAVGRSIVHQHSLNVAIGLPQHGVDATLERAFGIIDGDYD